MSQAIITNETLTDLGDAVRGAIGHDFTYTPSEMAEELNEYIVEKPWSRPDSWPDYDSYIKRARQDVLFFTCFPDETDSTVNFLCVTGDKTQYLVETGTVDENGFTADGDGTYVDSGSYYEADLGTDSEMVIIRVTAPDSTLTRLHFTGASYVAATDPIYEIWGSMSQEIGGNSYDFALQHLVYHDVLIYDGLMYSLNSLFSGSSTLEYVNTRRWDMSGVTSLMNMCLSATSLIYIDASNWDVSNVTDMANTFNKASSLTALDVSAWDVSNVTTLQNTFYGCSSLTALDVSAWDVSNVTTLQGTFQSCSSLTALDVSAWDVSNVTTLQGTFAGLNLVAELDLSGWTCAPTSMSYAFQNCKVLETLDLSGIDGTASTNNAGMFDYCYLLANLAMCKVTSSFSLSHDYSLTEESLQSVIDALQEVEETQTLTLHSTVKAMLTDEQIEAATEKGWTIA